MPSAYSRLRHCDGDSFGPCAEDNIIVYDGYYWQGTTKRYFTGFDDWKLPNCDNKWIGQYYGHNAEDLSPGGAAITAADKIYHPENYRATLQYGSIRQGAPPGHILLTSTAEFRALPTGQRLMIYSTSPGWPKGYYSCMKVTMQSHR